MKRLSTALFALSLALVCAAGVYNTASAHASTTAQTDPTGPGPKCPPTVPDCVK